MQFIKNGPEIPESLLEAHEEGRVVFFCGAGISYPAGLPTFSGLVSEVYKHLNIDKSPAEHEAFKAYKYDTTLGLLEQRLQNGRSQVRNAIAQSLIPDLKPSKATQTHEALLTLSKSRKGNTRLITTNFDRVFEEVITTKRLNTKSYSAPLLPVPKAKWDGLIYIHGLLDEKKSDTNLNSLVATSGDFGLAYLIERWAARFVSELFRNYTVCFVGYSINDPILRYMMDALAADSLMGESTPTAYAFGNVTKGKEEKIAREWATKNVVPILYHNYKNHYYLHETLHAWADSYRDGVNGMQAIVARYARIKPARTTKQDDFVRRMLWALSHDTGLPAKMFARADPVPSIEWLGVLNESRFGVQDLSRFDVSRNEKGFKNNTQDIKFSILSRPSPSSRAPFMSPVGMLGRDEAKWDLVMDALAKWLARHVNQTELLFWVIDQGGNLHSRFNWELTQSLKEQDASISAPMKRLWGFVLSGRAKRLPYSSGLYGWKESFKTLGDSRTVRFALKEALRPSLIITRPYSFQAKNIDSTPEKISDIANVEISLASDHVHSAYSDIQKLDGFNAFLPKILMDMSELLFETLDLMSEAEISSEFHDYSYIQLPSISEHDQNRDHNDWTLLVNLCRDAWMATVDTDPESAIAMLTLWARSKYPIFRRLVFFAIAQKPTLIPTDKSLDWLLSDNGIWLWSTSTMRETMRLLVSLGPVLSEEEAQTLQNAIIAGPPRSGFNDRISDEEYRRHFDRKRWIRLKKLVSGECFATQETIAVLQELEATYSEWELSPDERDEFPMWSSNGEDIVVQEAPKKLKDLIAWLRENPSADDLHNPDDWSKRCHDDFRRAAVALLKLTETAEWFSNRWEQALYAWSNDELATRSWKCTVQSVVLMPDEQFGEALHAITWWVNQNSTNISKYENEFFVLIDRTIKFASADKCEPDGVSLNHAINHPVGRAASSLLNWWFSNALEDGQGLPEQISGRFGRMCVSGDQALWLGTVVLAQQVIPLFRVDPAWTKEYLLAAFHWGDANEKAAAMWGSFLHAPRIYRPLLLELKVPFLAIPDHILELGDECSDQYARFLTYIALDEGSIFTTAEIKDAISRLPQASLEEMAQTLFNAAQGAGEERANYVKNRIIPFVGKFWPITEEARTEKISRYFAQICAISETAFEAVFKKFQNHLSTISDFNYLIHLLGKSNLADSHPSKILQLLDTTIPAQVQYLDDGLAKLLDRILHADPELDSNQEYTRLSILTQQHFK